MPGPFEFDRDTATRPLGGGRHAATVAEGYSIGAYPNGGYVLCLALAGAAAELPHADAVAVSAHFLAPAVPGDAVVEVEVLRVGRSLSTASTRLVQAGRERFRALVTHADLAALRGPTAVTMQPPSLPAVDSLSRDGADLGPMPNGLTAAIRERFDLRLDPATVPWAHGEPPSGRGEVAGWMRFADGREPDARCLPLLCDALPPAVFDLAPAGWVPTIEYSVHVRAHPANGWLRVRTRTRALINGLLEEDAEVWDAAGNLVAQSRQLARANPPR